MTPITADTLARVLPFGAEKNASIAHYWAGYFEPAMTMAGLYTPERQAAFLAQILHESQFLTRLEENLNYRPTTLVALFPKRVHSVIEANRLVERGPQAIANALYGGRMGNNTKDDGWTYRGRGLIQLTGRDNYAVAQTHTGHPLLSTPELAARPDVAVLVACWFFVWRDCLLLADQRDIDAISRRINGGNHGLQERRALYQKILGVLSGVALP